MKKIILFLLVFTLSFSTALDTRAEIQTVVGEKLWRIQMTLDINDTPTNLEKVQLIDNEGNIIPTIITVSDSDTSLLEVYSENVLTAGDYSIKVLEGFSSTGGEVLATTFIKNFRVDGNMSTDSLAGIWKTLYTYRGSDYEILATFINGKVDILAIDIATKTQYRTYIPENYFIRNGKMEMKITDLNLNLSGRVLVYNATQFKIKTESGKIAAFTKQ